MSWQDAAVLPEFVDVGEKDALLPPGIHPATMLEIEERLVRTSPTYRRRVDLWESFKQFRTLVHGLLPVQHEYLDGSFVTSRPAPKDTDSSFWINATDIDALGEKEQRAFGLLWSQRMSRFACDAYLVTPCDSAHPRYADYQYWKQKTETSWPAYKNRAKLVVPGVTKGYIEVVS